MRQRLEPNRVVVLKPLLTVIDTEMVPKLLWQV